MIEDIATLLSRTGDVGHVALFLWALSASALAAAALREVTRTARRFEAFVVAIARVNAMLAGPDELQTPDTQDLNAQEAP